MEYIITKKIKNSKNHLNQKKSIIVKMTTEIIKVQQLPYYIF